MRMWMWVWNQGCGLGSRRILEALILTPTLIPIPVRYQPYPIQKERYHTVNFFPFFWWYLKGLNSNIGSVRESTNCISSCLADGSVECGQQDGLWILLTKTIATVVKLLTTHLIIWCSGDMWHFNLTYLLQLSFSPHNCPYLNDFERIGNRSSRVTR